MDTRTTVGLAVIALFVAVPAYAYIDPGSGSMLVQLATSGAAGLLLLARLYWKRLKNSWTGKRATDIESPLGNPDRR